MRRLSSIVEKFCIPKQAPPRRFTFRVVFVCPSVRISAYRVFGNWCPISLFVNMFSHSFPSCPIETREIFFRTQKILYECTVQCVHSNTAVVHLIYMRRQSLENVLNLWIGEYILKTLYVCMTVCIYNMIVCSMIAYTGYSGKIVFFSQFTATPPSPTSL